MVQERYAHRNKKNEIHKERIVIKQPLRPYLGTSENMVAVNSSNFTRG